VTLVDEAARSRALTALSETLLVEAAAGTGKTALMAGRCALLLASGAEPGAIAAITFTELAAGELGLRIRQMVEALLRGEVPPELRPALPSGLSAAQRAKLEAVRERLDELTATTIHGFCQAMIRAYSVEADLDPGAAVMDGPQADAMFDGAFARWLRSKLSTDAEGAGAVGVLAGDDPLKVVSTLRELAQLRRRHLTARPPAVDLSRRPDLEFRDAIEGFERWAARQPGEPRTADLLGEMRSLADFFGDTLARPCGFAVIWGLASPPRTRFMKGKGLDWRSYSFKTAWKQAAGADDGPALFETALAHYEACRASFAALMGQIGGALIADLSVELDQLIADYAARKRAAAALDFDDLLLRACVMVRGHEEVRRALGRRYRYIFVDEFQDTDPIQAEVIFAVAADVLPARWTEAIPRPGGLFLVGDPKQAIYRFRGAHVAAYQAVRHAFVTRDPASVIQVTANFRSEPAILEHVNSCFRQPLAAAGQPGYVALAPTLEPHKGIVPCAAKITVDVQALSAGQQRDAEAEAVAVLCRRLVGSVDVRRRGGTRTPLRAGDIALLAPTGSELWRYERELEAQGLAVASQAGKALMRRQETQDVLALLRALADPFDTVAFGAFLRGPMVGLTEARLLGVTASLPPSPDERPGMFTLLTDPAQVADAEAREALEVLQALRRRAASATPAALLAEAAERLNLRVVLALRTGDRGGRAIANLDALITLARPYRVRGLAAFVADLNADWLAGRGVTEGRIDDSEDAISLITIHSAKGLEWPVVIPVNTGTQLRAPEQFVHRQSDDTLHWVLGGLLPPHLADARAEESAGAARERERLWYVACTRARDLLVLPDLIGAGPLSWARILDLGTARLPELEVATMQSAAARRALPEPNAQTPEVFAAEAAVIATAPPLIWRRPSDHDSDRPELDEVEPGEATEDLGEAMRPVGAGRVRGILLHNLLEEMVTGELVAELPIVAARAVELAEELRVLAVGETTYPDPSECAETALRARGIRELELLWPTLQAEVPLFATDYDGALVAGRADALSVVDGRIEAVVDWKSDLDPSSADRAAHANQILAYLRLTGASRGALVYLSRGEILWVHHGG
jgi:ATP-dependent exoDNAse (exonuclease V) beta subunit